MRRAAGRGGPHGQGVGAPPSGTQRASSARYLLTSHHPPPDLPTSRGLGGPGAGVVAPAPVVPPFTLTYLHGGTKERGWEGGAQPAPLLLEGLSRPSEEGPLRPKGRDQAEGMTRGHGRGLAGRTAILGKPPCPGQSASRAVGTGSTHTTPLHTGDSHVRLQTRDLACARKRRRPGRALSQKLCAPALTNTHEGTQSAKPHGHRAAERTGTMLPYAHAHRGPAYPWGVRESLFPPRPSWPPARPAGTWLWALWGGGRDGSARE